MHGTPALQCRLNARRTSPGSYPVGLFTARPSRLCLPAGASVVVVEASDGVGGRVRTDEVDGFLLDRGFQIFLTSYPEAQVGPQAGSFDKLARHTRGWGLRDVPARSPAAAGLALPPPPLPRPLAAAPRPLAAATRHRRKPWTTAPWTCGPSMRARWYGTRESSIGWPTP